MNKPKNILSRGYLVDDKYKVTFFLKRGAYAESYRVKDLEGKTKLLKLFDLSKLHRTQFTNEDEVLEIDILASINHPNLVKHYDNGLLLVDNKKYAYVILDFISGETIADKIQRESLINPYEAKDIMAGVLNGLNYLHTREEPIIHNDITTLNVMTDLSGSVKIPKVIDFGYARYLRQSSKEFLKEGLNKFYQPSEAFNKIFSAQNDVFAVGALYYHMLEGLPPWFVQISSSKSNHAEIEDIITNERRKPLKFKVTTDIQTQNLIKKALQEKTEDRFQSINEFIQALNGEMEVVLQDLSNTATKRIPKSLPKGKGFSAIAGMQELKDTIKHDVIDALNDKERYAEYGVTIPNGMLLYGPPGCGKTFFAERMAEEIGFNFYQLKPSDVQSKWVNASQENIKNIFEAARENAPSIIFMDELDAVVPNRNDSSVNHMNTSAVNEFLAQMNNCGEDDVFVIGATNRPEAIDPAITRAGRLDKLIYLPPPDFEAREMMFKLYLDKRPREIGLDYSALAGATENYVSSDIKFLCDEASRRALKQNTRITKDILLETIQKTRPSLTLKELKRYQTIKAKLESGGEENKNERPSIGFKK
jgi:transitional endoplasmic reticulum ATPase